jgi:hypothetical protein
VRGPTNRAEKSSLPAAEQEDAYQYAADRMDDAVEERRHSARRAGGSGAGSGTGPAARGFTRRQWPAAATTAAPKGSKSTVLFRANRRRKAPMRDASEPHEQEQLHQEEEVVWGVWSMNARRGGGKGGETGRDGTDGHRWQRDRALGAVRRRSSGSVSPTLAAKTRSGATTEAAAGNGVRAGSRQGARRNTAEVLWGVWSREDSELASGIEEMVHTTREPYDGHVEEPMEYTAEWTDVATAAAVAEAEAEAEAAAAAAVAALAAADAAAEAAAAAAVAAVRAEASAKAASARAAAEQAAEKAAEQAVEQAAERLDAAAAKAAAARAEASAKAAAARAGAEQAAAQAAERLAAKEKEEKEEQEAKRIAAAAAAEKNASAPSGAKKAAKQAKKGEEESDDEMVVVLERRGDGWAEEIFPSVSVQRKKPVTKKRRADQVCRLRSRCILWAGAAWHCARGFSSDARWSRRGVELGH